MNDLYDYMIEKRKELYQGEGQTVEIDMEHFFRIYQVVCFMKQIKNIVNFDEDLEQMQKGSRT